MNKHTKQEQRAEVVAVSDDASAEQGDWIQPGQWVAILATNPYYHGQISAVTPTHIFLEQASWVAHTDRLGAFLADPQKARAVEYVGSMAVERPITSIFKVPPGALKTK